MNNSDPDLEAMRQARVARFMPRPTIPNVGVSVDRASNPLPSGSASLENRAEVASCSTASDPLPAAGSSGLENHAGIAHASVEPLEGQEPTASENLRRNGIEQQSCRIMIYMPNLHLDGLLNAIGDFVGMTVTSSSPLQMLFGGGAHSSSQFRSIQNSVDNNHGMEQFQSRAAETSYTNLSRNAGFQNAGAGTETSDGNSFQNAEAGSERCVVGHGAPESTSQSEVIILSDDDSLPDVAESSCRPSDLWLSSPVSHASSRLRGAQPSSPSTLSSSRPFCNARPVSPLWRNRSPSIDPRAGESPITSSSGLNMLETPRRLFTNSVSAPEVNGSMNPASPLMERTTQSRSSLFSQRGLTLPSEPEELSQSLDYNSRLLLTRSALSKSDSQSSYQVRRVDYGIENNQRTVLEESVSGARDSSNANSCKQLFVSTGSNSFVVGHGAPEPSSYSENMLFSDDSLPDVVQPSPHSPVWLSRSPPLARAESVSPIAGPSGLNSGCSWNDSPSPLTQGDMDPPRSTSRQLMSSDFHQELLKAGNCSQRATQSSSSDKKRSAARYATCALQAAAASAAAAAPNEDEDEDAFVFASPRESEESGFRRSHESEEDEDEPAPKRKRGRGRPKGSKNLKKKETASANKPGNICNICKEPEQLQVTECGHLFHKKCLDNWVKISRQMNKKFKQCPLCGKQYASTFPFFG